MAAKPGLGLSLLKIGAIGLVTQSKPKPKPKPSTKSGAKSKRR